MCCTIYFDRETEEDIRALVKEISDSAAMRSGILRPSDAVTVISSRKTKSLFSAPDFP